MQEVDTIIHAKWIIPIVPKQSLLTDHSLVIDKKEILDILPTSECSKKYQSKKQRNLSNHVLMPGLVNTHTHAAMNLLRSLSDDLPLMTWLEKHIWPAENKWVSADFVRAGTKLAIAEMIRGGTTTMNDMYFYPDVAANCAIEAGMRAAVGVTVFDFPCAWGQGPDDYFSMGEKLYQDFAAEELITITMAPHAPYTVSDEPLLKIAAYSEKWQAPINMHVHETQKEVDDSLAASGQRPLARLNKLGLLNERFIAVHMTAVNDQDLELCQNSKLHVVTCPESNLKLASGFCPVDRLQKAGVNVAIGTDGAASNNDLDMFGELRTTAMLAKAISGDPTACDAYTVLEMATLGGAKAMGLADKIGSLERGKKADVIAIDLHNIENQPLYHIHSQLAYTNATRNVTDVWINGIEQLQDGKLYSLKEDELMATAQQWQEKIGSTDEH